MLAPRSTGGAGPGRPGHPEAAGKTGAKPAHFTGIIRC
jgi:hypothetical protein